MSSATAAFSPSDAPAGRSPVVAASDLDRTLIYSRNAWHLADNVQPELVCVEEYDGGPLSYLTARAASLLAELAHIAVFVPTTTRTRTQLERITLPGPAPTYAIAANGGILLVNGQPDADWAAAVTAQLASSSSPLAEVQAHMATAFTDAWTLKRRVAEDLFCYAVVDRAALPASFMTELADWAGARGWGVSLQGRKVYLVPLGLTKRAAVTELAARLGARRVLAAGDSALDAEMLESADAAIRPAHGELADADWRMPHVHVTLRRGILGGEDVAGWLLKEAYRARDTRQVATEHATRRLVMDDRPAR